MKASANKKSGGLITSLSIGTTLPVVLVILIMGIAMVLVLSNRVEDLVDRNARQTLSLVEKMVNTEVDSAVQNYLRGVAEKNRELMALYNDRIMSGELTRAQAFSRVRSVFLDPDYGRIGTTGYLAGVSSQGILSIHPASEGVDASGFEFMQQAIAMKNGYLEYEWKNVDEEEPRMKAGYLSFYEPWDIMVWASSYKSEFLSLIDRQALNERISTTRVDEIGYLLLRDREGKLIAGQDSLLILENNLFEPGSTLKAPSPRGRVRIDSRVLDSTGWELILVSPLARYDHLLTLLRIVIAASLLLSALFLHLITRLLLSRRLKPIESMREKALEISEGNLTGRLRRLTDDEIGEVGHILNQVIGEFAGVLLKVKSVIETLTKSIQDLSSSAQEIASTSNEQAAAVKEILSTMEDADQVSKDNLVKVEEVTRIAKNTQENVEKGFGLIKTSLGKMEEIRTTNSDTISGIRNLGERINSIWEIVNIINSIADQTKIIAFNAELEAAAAGEAGKNFQIVAGEIRRLADGTVNSTKEIKSKINEIQHASDKLIIASEEGTQRISEGWNISTNIRGIFEEVLSSSEVTAGSADNIARSTRMQVSSFEQIFTTLKQISESIDSFVESTNYTNEVSDHLKEIADSFRSEVNAYTVEEEPSSRENEPAAEEPLEEEEDEQ